MIKKLSVSASLMLMGINHAYAAGSAEHADAHHESTGGLPQLDPTFYASQTFWLVTIFVFMYIIFSAKSLPTISSAIENRAERIKNDLSSAERVKKEVETVQSSYEESLKEAREKSSKLFSDIESQIKNSSEEHAKKFSLISSEKISELEKNIANARNKAMEEMSEIAVDIASEAAEKIIGVKADAKAAKKIVASINKKAA
ncbi:MAG: hypothetical protein ACRBDI_01080 [Alphaproteobacteria bacterium]